MAKQRGRPIKCTKKLVDDFCDARSQGASLKLCSAYAGIAYETFDDWRTIAKNELKRRIDGEEPDRGKEIFLYFIHELRSVEAATAITWQQVVHGAAQTDPVWAWRMLQNWFPDDYAQPTNRTQQELTGPGGTPLQTSTITIYQIPDNGRDDHHPGTT